MSHNTYAKVIADSIGPNNKRLISLEIKYWSAIHGEVMSHRDKARNAASNRAIPFIRYLKDKSIAANCTYKLVQSDMCIPEFIGKEQRGMQSGEDLAGQDLDKVRNIIQDMGKYCLDKCMELHSLNVHKSIINRYLAPWSYMILIISGTTWENLFRLRIHPKAEKHFNKVAMQMKQAIQSSTPNKLQAGDWHLPYIRVNELPDIKQFILSYGEVDLKLDSIKKNLSIDQLVIELAKRISAARCARVSYLNHDGIKDYGDDIKLFNALINPVDENGEPDPVIHSSPLEHIAQASDDTKLRSGPYSGWYQFRKEFVNEYVE